MFKAFQGKVTDIASCPTCGFPLFVSEQAGFGEVSGDYDFAVLAKYLYIYFILLAWQEDKTN